MGLIGGIWLLLLGVLGAANLIIARKPSAKELIAKLAPYQGWFGVVSAFWGIWGIISSILSLGWLAYMPIYWATYMGASVLQTILGILLGIGTMKTFVKQPQAVEKLDALVTRMAPKQGVLGFIAIGTGAWMIVAGFFFMSAAVGAVGNVIADNAEAIAAAQQAALAAGQMTPEQAQAMAQAQQAAMQMAAAAGGAAGQMGADQAQAMAQAQQAATQMAAAAGQLTAEQAQAMAQASQAAMQAAAGAAGQLTAEQAQAMAQASQAAMQAAAGAAGQLTAEQAQAMAQASQAAMQAAAGAAGQLTAEQQQAMAAAQEAAAQGAAAVQQAAAQEAAAATAAAPGGTAATALVQQTWPAGVDGNQQPLMGIDLYVYPPNGTPYQVRLLQFPVPAAKQAMVTPQATINVSIDPNNPMNVTPLL